MTARRRISDPSRARYDRMWDLRHAIDETLEFALEYCDLSRRLLRMGDDLRADDTYSQMIKCFKEVAKLRAELACLRNEGGDE